MNLEETILLAKLFSVSIGFDSPDILSDFELDLLKDLLKRMANNNDTLNELQRNILKYLADELNEFLKSRKKLN